VIRRIGRKARWLAEATYRQGRRIVVIVVGGTVLLAGLVMVVTPGPAVVVVPLGLSILAIEFVWARRWLRKLKEGGAAMARSVGVGRSPGQPPPEHGEGESGPPTQKGG